QVMHMLTVMIVGLAMGATVMIGQAVGAGQKEKASLAVGNTATLFFSLSLVTTALLLIAVRPIVEIMSTPKEAVAGTVAYLTICFMGIPFITAYNIISSIFRGLGDSRSPMYFIAVACVVNIGLDYLLIGGFGLGAAGAALGTTLSQTVSVITAFVVIRGKRTGLTLSKKTLKPQREIMGRILRIGIPIAMQDGFIQISFVVITIIANRRGLSDAAAVGIVEKIIGILFLVPSSMLQSVSALAAQNVGAGKYDRARRTLFYASLMSLLWGLLAVAVMQYDAETFVGLFADDAVVLRLGGQYMRGYVWDAALAGIHFCFSGYFCAHGLSGISFVHNSISIVCVRIPFAYLASKYFADTLFPMGLASTAGSGISVLICIGVFFWLEKMW
ncbi:MAG: MATE family efflux transporter, partial [Lachnospiraceae bacterium]|nr:MATE family efflux transporter [Lachnospiraceae bacterium]